MVGVFGPFCCRSKLTSFTWCKATASAFPSISDGTVLFKFQLVVETKISEQNYKIMHTDSNLTNMATMTGGNS